MLKIVFVGTADFACSSLESLIEATEECKIVAVYTKPDKPKGRGLKLLPSAVKRLAIDSNLPVVQPPSLRQEDSLQQLGSFGADLLVNVACGFILPPEVLAMFPYGCVNVHPSLLPRWRGAAPIQRAIMAGDRVTGVSIMQMDEGLDTGDIYLQERVEIDDTDNYATLAQRLATLGGSLLKQVLIDIAHHRATSYKQSSSGVTYADKIDKTERVIDWQESARAISCRVRALNPECIAYTTLNGQRWLVRDAREGDASELGNKDILVAGQIITVQPEGVAVAAGDQKVVWLTSLQAEGGRPLTAKDFYNAYRNVFTTGSKLGN